MANTTPSPQLQLMRHDPEWSLLDRFFSGECSTEESAAVEQWASAGPENRALLAFLRRVWTEAAAGESAVDERVAWEALRERIERAGAWSARPSAASRAGIASSASVGIASELALPPRRRLLPALLAGRRRVSLVRRTLPLAAGVVLALGSAAYWWQHESRVPGHLGAGAVRVYATARAQRMQLMLPDSTRVWLSVDTRLRVPEDFGERTRDVELSGEAYFVVRHDARRPFRVHTRRAVSEDLGTAFAVRAYPGDPWASVIVASGCVALRRAGAERTDRVMVELTHGQMGRLDSHGHVTVTGDIDVNQLLAWRNGLLEFDSRPLRDVVAELERWYDLDISVGDTTLLRTPITASLAGQTDDQALAIIARTLDVTYRRHGRHVLLGAVAPARRH